MPKASGLTSAVGEPAPPAFLRVPPFPGAPRQGISAEPSATSDCEDLVELVRKLRVGGTYWGYQPELPERYVVVTSPSAAAAAGGRPDMAEAAVTVTSGHDPWHVLERATALVTHTVDELCVVAAALNVPVHVVDEATGALTQCADGAQELLRKALSSHRYRDPFTREPMSARAAIELCGMWRRLVDSNRDIGAAIGFAFWKQQQVQPLLWGGSGPVNFIRTAREAPEGAAVAIWRSRASAQATSALEHSNVPLIEIEDGFVRSQGLGADCIPPLSIIVDRLGAYFDPRSPSELELLLQEGSFDATLVDRARRLRAGIVDAGLGKYERAGGRMERPAGSRRHILVPGQVEDDRAVQSGGCGLVSNLDLLARVRAEAPGAFILYKPHPDVLAGHRRGAVSERECLGYADQIVADAPVSTLISMVDEVHVNTSLTGFEALLREKPVTTYGVPFYAGWGLTCDLGPVPSRRTAKRTLDELVAAALLLYPRYLDPVTGLPCPAEILVRRLVESIDPPRTGVLVALRRLQGRCRRAAATLWSRG